MSDLQIRRATAADIPVIVSMLADDELGAARETPGDLRPYQAAFARLAEDRNQYLAVAEQGGAVVGFLQLTIIPGLSRQGTTRGLIEAVRVHREARSAGIGGQLIRWAIEESRQRGCRLVQLTSDRSRAGAHRFYERLGFTGSHVGFKLNL